MADNALDFFSTYMMTAALEMVKPEKLFFKDRYFPTGAGDIFNTDKVLIEVKKGSRKIAPFVAERAPAVPIERTGYEVYEYAPAKIAVKRTLTIDDLKKRGFGEAIYSNSTPAQRAARLEIEDMTEMDKRISRREEWMSVQTMMNNACTMQESVDAKKKGNTKQVQFFESNSSEHKYTPANPWNSSSANVIGDTAAMCKLLTARGFNPTDMIIGPDVEDVFYNDEQILRQLDKNLNIDFGAINQEIIYPGISILGRNINFRGHKLTIYVASNSYEDDNGTDTPYFPSDGVLITFPKCGHTMYGRVDQMNYGSVDFTSVAAKRVAKFFCKNDDDEEVRGLRLQTRPLMAPKNYCPYIFAPHVVS